MADGVLVVRGAVVLGLGWVVCGNLLVAGAEVVGAAVVADGVGVAVVFDGLGAVVAGGVGAVVVRDGVADGRVFGGGDRVPPEVGD